MGLGLGSLVDARPAAWPAGWTTSTSSRRACWPRRRCRPATRESHVPGHGRDQVAARRTTPVLATPLTAGDLLVGHLLFVALPGDHVGGALPASRWSLFGAAAVRWSSCALPAAVLTGLAFAAPVTALAATRGERHARSPPSCGSASCRCSCSPGRSSRSASCRLASSGSPTSPRSGTASTLCRGLALGTSTPAPPRGHVGYLVALVAVGSCWPRARSSGGWSRDAARSTAPPRPASLLPRRRCTRCPPGGPAPRRAQPAGRTAARWLLFVSGFFEPLFYLLSIGVGVGALVGDVDVDPAGRSSTTQQFVAPALLAASAMNGAVFDSTFNVFFKLQVQQALRRGAGHAAVGAATSPSARSAGR